MADDNTSIGIDLDPNDGTIDPIEDANAEANAAGATKLGNKKTTANEKIDNPTGVTPADRVEYLRLKAEAQTAQITGDYNLYNDLKLEIKELANARLDLLIGKTPSINDVLQPTLKNAREILEIMILDEAPPLQLVAIFLDEFFKAEDLSKVNIPYTPEELIKMHAANKEVMQALSPEAKNGYSFAMDKYAKALTASVSAQTGTQGNNLKVLVAQVGVGLGAELSKSKYTIDKSGIVNEKTMLGLSSKPVVDLMSAKSIAQFSNEKMPKFGIDPKIIESLAQRPGQLATRQNFQQKTQAEKAAVSASKTDRQVQSKEQAQKTVAETDGIDPNLTRQPPPSQNRPSFVDRLFPDGKPKKKATHAEKEMAKNGTYVNDKGELVDPSAVDRLTSQSAREAQLAKENTPA